MFVFICYFKDNANNLIHNLSQDKKILTKRILINFENQHDTLSCYFAFK